MRVLGCGWGRRYKDIEILGQKRSCGVLSVGPRKAVGVESELNNIESVTLEVFGGFGDDDFVFNPIMVWAVGLID